MLCSLTNASDFVRELTEGLAVWLPVNESLTEHSPVPAIILSPTSNGQTRAHHR